MSISLKLAMVKVTQLHVLYLHLDVHVCSSILQMLLLYIILAGRICKTLLLLLLLPIDVLHITNRMTRYLLHMPP